MTREDHLLDPNLLANGEPPVLYRLARAKYANLTGIGAAQYPGRWNLADQEAIYTSTNRSTTVLERLVHTRKDSIPSDYALMTIGLKGSWIHSGNELVERQSKAAIRIYRSLLEARHLATGVAPILSLGSRPLAIAVPSVVDPQWNIVLYPGVENFDRLVTLLSVEPFEFDPRLFPEDTPKDIEEI